MDILSEVLVQTPEVFFRGHVIRDIFKMYGVQIVDVLDMFLLGECYPEIFRVITVPSKSVSSPAIIFSKVCFPTIAPDESNFFPRNQWQKSDP